MAFLKARLDEDEAAAKSAAHADGADWFVGSSEDADERSILCEGPSTLYAGLTAEYQVAGRIAEETAPHIARHDPARVLREVEAKRRRLKHWIEAGRDADDPPGYSYLAVLDDASVYSGHPDYRQEWKPYPRQPGRMSITPASAASSRSRPGAVR